MKKNKNKVALITGVTGQDGAYLAEFLLQKGAIDQIIDRREMKTQLSHLITLLRREDAVRIS